MFGSKAKDKRTSTGERREKDRISLSLVQEKEEKKTKGEKEVVPLVKSWSKKKKGQSIYFILFDCILKVAGFTFTTTRTKDKIPIGPLSTMFIFFGLYSTASSRIKGKARS
jgi:hypothetical protein